MSTATSSCSPIAGIFSFQDIEHVGHAVAREHRAVHVGQELRFRSSTA